MKPPKVVFDTNIFISAILFGGNPLRCLELSREGKIIVVTSKAILLELAEKMNKKFDWGEEEVRDLIEGIAKFAEILEPKEKIDLIKKDPSDNRVLEVAKEAQADFIISGDKKHILPLRMFEGTRILTAADFIKQFSSKN